MVEFSKSEDLERWLEGKPREWSGVIAARAALRVVPLLAAAPHASDIERELVLPTLRGITASWFVGAWPIHRAKVDWYVNSSCTAAAAASNQNYHVADAAVGAALYAAASALDHATDDSVTGDARFAVEKAAGDHAYAAEIWASVSRDASELEAGVSVNRQADDLAGQSLWFGNTPGWANENWIGLKRALLALNQDWEVWTDWYEARLRGSSAIEELELARVQIAGEIWQQGPKVVNAHIKKLIEEFRKQEEDVADWEDLDGVETDLKPPTIPASRRAAVEPVWSDGKLTIPKQPIAVDLKQHEFPAALQALRAGLQKFAADIDGEANIDRRFISYMRGLAAQIPDDPPPQHVLFELGHAEEVFITYAASVNEQWPEFLAARFHALVRQHDNTMRQAPAWRDFKRNALRDTLTVQQVVDVAPLATQVSNALRNEDAQQFIDSLLPDALDVLSEPLRRPPPDDAAEEWRHAIEAGNELLALDVIESINNTLKRIAQAAVAIGANLGKAGGIFTHTFGEGVFEGAAEEGRKYGKRMVKWLCAGATAGATVGLQQLILTYPHAFGWLGSVIDFLSKLHFPA